MLFVLANPNTNVLHKLAVTGLLDTLNGQFGESHDWVFLSVTDAVDAVRVFEPPLAASKDVDKMADFDHVI